MESIYDGELIEKSLLGCILQDLSDGARYDALGKCLQAGITRDSFTNNSRGDLFAMLVEHVRGQSNPNRDTFDVWIKERHPAESDAILETAIAAAKTESFATHTEYFIDRVKHHDQNEKLSKILLDTLKDVNSGEFVNDAKWLASRLEGKLMELFPPVGQSVSMVDAFQQAKAKLHNLLDNGAAAMEGLSSGFARLDSVLFGLKNGEMVVVAARPSVGKTTLGMNIAQNVAREGHKVLVFSREMDRLALARRMLGGEAKINQFMAANGKYTDPTEIDMLHQNLDDACERLSKLPLFVEVEDIVDVAQVRAQARLMRRREQIELIVVDYLQLLNCDAAAKGGRQLETARMSAEMKNMARELNVPVILLSQLSRAPEKSGDKKERPKLSDLRDSGAIEQDADVVMLLRRPGMIKDQKGDEVLKDIVYIDVAKNRNGTTGEIPMRFNGPFNRFEELKEDRYQEVINYDKINAAETASEEQLKDALNDDEF